MRANTQATEISVDSPNAPVYRRNGGSEALTDPEVLDFYVDSASVRTSPWTVLLEFGRHSMPAEGQSISEPLVRLRMSPQHAKATLLILTQVLEQYEANSGPISLGQIVVEQESEENDLGRTS